MSEITKIALIYANFYRPVKMYYIRWPEQFRNQEIETKYFSLVSSNHHKPKDTTFYFEGWGNKIRRSVKFFTENPSSACLWFKTQKTDTIYEKLKLWFELGKLIQYQPNVVHLINSHNYTKINRL